MKKTITETTEAQCSVRFTINAKGEWSGELKKYAENVGTAYNAALTHAETMEKLIRDKNKLNKGVD